MSIFELNITQLDKLLLLFVKEYNTQAFTMKQISQYTNTTPTTIYQNLIKLEKANIITLSWSDKKLFIKFDAFEIAILNPTQFKTKLVRKAKTLDPYNKEYGFIGFNRKVYEFGLLYSKIVGDKLDLPVNLQQAKNKTDWKLLNNVFSFIEANNLDAELFLKAQLYVTNTLQKNSNLKITKYLVLSTKNALSHYSSYIHSINDKKLDINTTQKDSIKEALQYSQSLINNAKSNFPDLSDEEILIFTLESLSPVYLSVNPVYLRLINTTLKPDDRVLQVLHKLKNNDHKNLVLSLYKEVLNEEND